MAKAAQGAGRNIVICCDGTGNEIGVGKFDLAQDRSRALLWSGFAILRFRTIECGDTVGLDGGVVR